MKKKLNLVIIIVTIISITILLLYYNVNVSKKKLQKKDKDSALFNGTSSKYGDAIPDSLIDSFDSIPAEDISPEDTMLNQFILKKQ